MNDLLCRQPDSMWCNSSSGVLVSQSHDNNFMLPKSKLLTEAKNSVKTVSLKEQTEVSVFSVLCTH